jgi:hypothetical protein
MSSWRFDAAPTLPRVRRDQLERTQLVRNPMTELQRLESDIAWSTRVGLGLAIAATGIAPLMAVTAIRGAYPWPYLFAAALFAMIPLLAAAAVLKHDTMLRRHAARLRARCC